MGRRSTGYALKPHISGFWYVRFTWQGRRKDLSTGCRGKEEAYVEAQKIYASYISGNHAATQPAAARSGMSIIDAGAEWLASVGPSLDPLTLGTYERYVTTLYHPWFGTVGTIPEKAEGFGNDRLKHVQRETLLKELSGLRGLTRWALGDKVADAIAPPQSKATGVVVFDRKVTELAPTQVQRILAALIGPAREYFTVLYETGLRPATLFELETPKHYKRGGRSIHITNEIDKARFGRELPLTRKARRALDLACPDSAGLIFGHVDHREALERACARAKQPRCTPYDLRHAMGTHLVETSGNLPGVAYLMGHRDTATTSSRYVHPNKRAALAVLKGAR